MDIVTVLSTSERRAHHWFLLVTWVMTAISALTMAASLRFRTIMRSLDQAAAMEQMTRDLRAAMAQLDGSAAAVAVAGREVTHHGERLTDSLERSVAAVAALRTGFREQAGALSSGTSSTQRIASAVEQISGRGTGARLRCGC